MARVLVLLAWVPVCVLCYDYAPQYSSPRIVQTRQGLLQGTVRTLRNLDPVEVYLGVPYAAAHQRFMPPASPPPWPGTRVADTFAPVCPQSLPERPHASVSSGRWAHLDRVRRLLSNQSEDCLYLNIYAPIRGQSSVVICLRQAGSILQILNTHYYDLTHFFQILVYIKRDNVRAYLTVPSRLNILLPETRTVQEVSPTFK